MVESRSLSQTGAAPAGAARDLDYCRRLSAYLGLSLETAILLTRQSLSGSGRQGAKARAAR